MHLSGFQTLKVHLQLVRLEVVVLFSGMACNQAKITGREAQLFGSESSL